jgi:membrane-bound ClpP family serine protease
MSWIIFLFLIGLLLLLLELFVTPGFLIGIFGLLSWGLAIGRVYDLYGTLYGNVATVFVLLFIIFSVYLGIKGKIWSKVTVHSTIHGKANGPVDFSPTLGMKGLTVSTLRPTGSARFDTTVVEVVTQGEWITHGQNIEIIEIDGHKIIVKASS